MQPAQHDTGCCWRASVQQALKSKHCAQHAESGLATNMAWTFWPTFQRAQGEPDRSKLPRRSTNVEPESQSRTVTHSATTHLYASPAGTSGLSEKSTQGKLPSRSQVQALQAHIFPALNMTIACDSACH